MSLISQSKRKVDFVKKSASIGYVANLLFHSKDCTFFHKAQFTCEMELTGIKCSEKQYF